MKEFIRKKIAGLKRSPQIIPILFLVISCCIYTFALGAYSTASLALYNEAYIETIKSMVDASFNVPGLYRNPAIYVFVQSLFSLLLVITFLSVYKKGKRNNFMYSITLGMIVIMIACDLLYYLSIDFYTAKYPVGYELPLTAERVSAMTNSIVHLVSLVISLLAVVLMPVYAKLIYKIDTSVDDEYDRLMEQKSDEEMMIELEDET